MAAAAGAPMGKPRPMGSLVSVLNLDSLAFTFADNNLDDSGEVDEPEFTTLVSELSYFVGGIRDERVLHHTDTLFVDLCGPDASRLTFDKFLNWYLGELALLGVEDLPQTGPPQLPPAAIKSGHLTSPAVITAAVQDKTAMQLSVRHKGQPWRMRTDGDKFWAAEPGTSFRVAPPAAAAAVAVGGSPTTDTGVATPRATEAVSKPKRPPPPPPPSKPDSGKAAADSETLVHVALSVDGAGGVGVELRAVERLESRVSWALSGLWKGQGPLSGAAPAAGAAPANTSDVVLDIGGGPAAGGGAAAGGGGGDAHPVAAKAAKAEPKVAAKADGDQPACACCAIA